MGIVTSFIPGRIRLRHRMFRDDDIAGALIALFKASGIVTGVERNPETGSILITYRADVIPSADVLAKSQNEDNSAKADEKKEGAEVDISKPAASTVRKRFFEIDAKIGKKTVGGVDVSSRRSRELSGENAGSSKDEERFVGRKSKFKDLQFGKEFDIGGNDIEDFSTGAYSGIFRK